MTTLLGAHVSTAGGIPTAPGRAKAIGATALQLFTKQANRWAERGCEGEECLAWRAALADSGVGAVVSPRPTAATSRTRSPDEQLRFRSTISFVCELRRCEQLGVDYLVSHPGNFMDDRDAGIARNAEGMTAGLECVPGRTMLLMETTAGSGTAIGASFEELARLIELVPEPARARIGVCLDTAHVFAAGYDLVHDYDGVIARFDDTIGLARLRVMHLNDSKVPLGSRKDRHELIGEGAIGEGAFRRIMTDERLAGVVKVIETPKLDDAEATDTRMLERLRGYATAGA
jgi:deoxyribonuclease IV